MVYFKFNTILSYQLNMEKIIYLPVFFTATIKEWKPLLQPDKYKNIILQKLKQLVDDHKIIIYAYCPDNYRDA